MPAKSTSAGGHNNGQSLRRFDIRKPAAASRGVHDVLFKSGLHTNQNRAIAVVVVVVVVMLVVGAPVCR